MYSLNYGYFTESSRNVDYGTSTG